MNIRIAYLSLDGEKKSESCRNSQVNPSWPCNTCNLWICNRRCQTVCICALNCIYIELDKKYFVDQNENILVKIMHIKRIIIMVRGMWYM